MALPSPLTPPDPPFRLDELDEALQAADDAAYEAGVDLDVRSASELVASERLQRVLDFRPVTLGEAEYIAESWRDDTDQLAELDRQMRAWNEQIRDWYLKVSKAPRRRILWAEAVLEAYALARREADERRNKTTVLPAAVIATTGHQSRIVIEDEPRLLAWVKENLEEDEIAKVVKVTEKVMVSELRAESARIESHPADVVLTCGCLVTLSPVAPPARPAMLGDAVICPACGTEALIGRVDRWLRFVVDEAHRLVPGATASEPKTTAKITPVRP